MVGVFTERERRRLAGRARTLHERLQRPADADERTDEADEWVDEWRERVADGDDEAFRRRLAYDDVGPESCARRLSAGWPDDEPIPDWVDTLDDLLAFVAETDLSSAAGADLPPPVADLPDAESVPFVDVLGHFVAYARERREFALAPEAERIFEKWLLDRLKFVCAQTLFVEFRTFVTLRAEEDETMPDDPFEAASPESREWYEAFTSGLLEKGLKPFFLEYSYLGRLLVTTIDQWVGATDEFCSRLDADRAALGEAFADGDSLGDVTDVEVLGDRHRNGRGVVGVTFDSGTRIAYKPRPIDVEDAFYRLLEWVDDRSELPSLATLDCLTREEYGWTEWATTEECRTTDEVSQYYRRAGMLVCLLYVTNFTDGHYENVVADGDHPILVDAETIAQPALSGDETSMSAPIADVMADSVFRTSFLPVQVDDADSWNTSGFGVAEVTFESVDAPNYTDVNTDAMDLEFEDEVSVSGENLPRIDGEVCHAADYCGDVERGFEAMAEFVFDAREDLLAADGPLQAFEGARLRYLHRSTSTYGSVLKSLRKPKYLRTGALYGCKTEALAKSFAMDSIDADLWPVYECERTALTRLDVPRFELVTTGTDLSFDGETVVELLDETPLEAVRNRLREFDRESMEKQLATIRLAFGESDETPRRTAVESEAASETLSDAEFEQVAGRIADRIADSATRDRDGHPAWYLWDRHPEGGAHLRAVEADFTAGRVGIGVFLAASARVRDDEQSREFAREVVAPVRDALRDDDPFPDYPVGGGTGLGSIVYGFTKLAELLGDDRYLEDARQAAECLTPDRIRDDDAYDVVVGSAGGLLGLLALYDATGEESIRDRAVTCGDHLLSERVRTDEGTQVWRTVGDEGVLTGFSHGVSGIAYALVRLADVTGETRFEAAALESLDFEREQYAPDCENWRDVRSETAVEFPDAWCYGRSGIGLSRLGMAERTSDDSVRRDLDRALSGLDATMLTDDDHVCCGNFGRVGFALDAGRTLDESEYVETARRLATASIERARSNGEFAVEAQTDHWSNPTFFKGEAGIGYETLRLVSPDLPCVLRWE